MQHKAKKLGSVNALESYNTKQRGESYRLPLRTVKEMAVEFGISQRSLLTIIIKNDHSLIKLRTSKSTREAKKGTVSWVEPIAMRKWWAEYKLNKESK